MSERKYDIEHTSGGLLEPLDLDTRIRISELQISRPTINGMIVQFIDSNQSSRFADSFLWEEFIDNFQGWTADHFRLADNGALQELRDFLRKNGVFVHCGRGLSKAGEVAKLVREDDEGDRPPFHIWSPEEIQEQVTKFGGFSRHSRLYHHSTTGTLQPTHPKPSRSSRR